MVIDMTKFHLKKGSHLIQIQINGIVLIEIKLKKHFSSHWPLTFRSIGPERKVKIICNYNPISSSLLRRFCCHTIFNHQFTYRLTVLSRKWVLQETPFYNIRTPTRPRIEFTFINNVYFKLLTPIDLIR